MESPQHAVKLFDTDCGEIKRDGACAQNHERVGPHRSESFAWTLERLNGIAAIAN